MNNLIITIISIGLVAVTAIAGIYYGSDYLPNAAARRNAIEIITTMDQIKTAWNACVDERGAANCYGTGYQTDTLKNLGYLAVVPAFPPFGHEVFTQYSFYRVYPLDVTLDGITGGHYVQMVIRIDYSTVRDKMLLFETCRQINKIKNSIPPHAVFSTYFSNLPIFFNSSSPLNNGTNIGMSTSYPDFRTAGNYCGANVEQYDASSAGVFNVNFAEPI